MDHVPAGARSSTGPAGTRPLLSDQFPKPSQDCVRSSDGRHFFKVLEPDRPALDPESAAIASREAARLYGLRVVASKIEDHSRNTTRFLIIGRTRAHRTGTDKTSIMFSAPHIPGSLYKVLEPIAESGINMLKLESRPSKHENWNYFFFVDLEGHAEDQIVRDTMDRMKQICLFLKSLGSYPRGGEPESLETEKKDPGS